MLCINNPMLNVSSRTRPPLAATPRRISLIGEWDLNDPDYLKKDMPARVSDDDPRCGAASLQRFQGEDLNSLARAQYQREQMREWSRLQQEDQRRAAEQQRAADQLFHAKQIELDQRAMALQRAEEQCRRDVNHSVRNYNDALVGARHRRGNRTVQSVRAIAMRNLTESSSYELMTRFIDFRIGRRYLCLSPRMRRNQKSILRGMETIRG